MVNALWDSWRPGALRPGPDGHAVLDRDLVQPIHHRGEYFQVTGPLNIPPLPQGRPVQIAASQSAAGIALAARYAEVAFTALSTLDAARDYTTRVRRQAAELGRPPGLPLIFSSFHATYGATEQEARRLVRERHEAIDFEAGRALVADMLGGGDRITAALAEAKLDEPLPDSVLPELTSVHRRRGRAEVFSGYARAGQTLRELIIAAQDTGHWTVAGTPEQLADAVEERFRAGVLDVLSLNGLADDRQHDFVVNGLLPELRRRGIVKADYTGATLRANLGLPHPGVS